jgi:hypothetical protein
MKVDRSFRLVLSTSILAIVLGPNVLSATPRGRNEVHIRRVTVRKGTERFSIPIRVGSTVIEAGLDTGSTGLRVLPGVLGASDAQATTKQSGYSYGSGVRLTGGLSDSTTLQLVRRIGCTKEKPKCSAAHIPAARFGIMGSGVPGEGFKAIFGISMAPTGIANPLAGVGATRWIVELPRRGERSSGRLTLDPSDAEASGFAMFPVLGDSGTTHGPYDGIPACIVNEGTGEKACGVLTVDTGATGITVVNSDLHRPWRQGTRALLTFGDATSPRLGLRFVVGKRAEGSHVALKKSPKVDGVAIRAGIMPYFALAVLYDPGQEMIGLRPRPAVPGEPTVLSASQLVAAGRHRELPRRRARRAHR